MSEKSNSLSLQFKVLSYKQKLRNQFIEQSKKKARKQIMDSNQQERFKQQRNAMSNNAPISIHDQHYYSHPVRINNSIQLIDQGNPFYKRELQSKQHFKKGSLINLDQYLLTAVKFGQSAINQQNVRQIIKVEIMIKSFWLEIHDYSNEGAPKQYLTHKQQKILRILDKISKILVQQQITDVLQIYLFILRKDLFYCIQYLISPLIQFLKKGFIGSETDESIYLIFKHLRTHKFKRPEYLGQLIHFSSIILANYLAGIYKQNNLKIVQGVFPNEKCHLELVDIKVFFQQVVDFGNTFMPKGDIADVQNIMQNLLFSVKILMKIYYSLNCAFQLIFLQLMIEIMYESICISKNHFKNIHRKLLNTIIIFLKEEKQRRKQLIQLTLIDSYLSCLSSSQPQLFEGIAKIFHFYQENQLNSMKFYNIQKKYGSLQREMRLMQFEDRHSNQT